jgi:hypothetical protein
MQVTNNGQLVIYNSDSVAIWMTPVPNSQTQDDLYHKLLFP